MKFRNAISHLVSASVFAGFAEDAVVVSSLPSSMSDHQLVALKDQQGEMLESGQGHLLPVILARHGFGRSWRHMARVA